MKNRLSMRRRQAAPPWAGLLLMLILFPMALQHIAANPTGETIMAGTAGFSRSGDTLTINQGSNRVIIHWDDFSIANGELTRFVQPSANAAALNRVTGGNPSAIHGMLQANGTIYLINPNGILVGPSGVIETGAFIASTQDINNADFMDGGDMTFSGTSSAAIRIEGSITATHGDLILIAQEIVNQGTLSVPNGTASLAAGSEVLVKDTQGDQRVFVRAGTGQVVNDGLIEAARAELRAAGGNPYALAINNTGTIRATGVAEHDGQVWLVATRGETRVSGLINSQRGNTGGDIRTLGETVTLTDSAQLNATGDLGGGSILVGGDYQGSNPDIMNATETTVAEGAVLDASALVNGDGGRVIVWADDSASFAGLIRAQGGADGGDGGLAEVSGKVTLAYSGYTNLLAPNGQTGDLLIDPTTIEIVTGGADAVGGVGANLQIDPNTLIAALGGANITLQADTLITVTDNIVLGAINTNNLTLDTLNPGSSIVINAASIDMAGGDLTFSDPVTINAANVELTGAFVTFTGTVTAGAGANELIVNASDIDIRDTVDYTGKNVTLRNRVAGDIIDLGTRTDPIGNNTLELSNPEIMFITADKLTLGRSNAGNMFISQKISPNVNTLHLITGGDILKGTPSAVPFDLNTWSERGILGPDDGIHNQNDGEWIVGGGGTSVEQYDNAENPTFFMSNDTTGYVGVVFEGTLEVGVGTGDNDYIGFVFGAKKPTAAGSNEFDFYLFDWVNGNFAGNQKFMLSKVDDPNNTGTHSSNNLWTRSDNASVDMLQVGSNIPWTKGVSYDFRISYDKDNITAEVKGGAFGASFVEVINYDNPDPVNNPFTAGDFGFYNLSQDHSNYSNFTLTEQPALELATGNLAITAGGNVSLTEKVDVTNIAIQAGGSVDFRDDNGFNITTIDGVSGINANAGASTVKLQSLGNVTQDAAINASALELAGSSANYTLNSANAFDTLAADVASVDITETNGFAVGTVGTTSGITTTGVTSLNSSGAITQTQAITASALKVNATTATLSHAGNDVDTLAGNVTNLSFRDSDGLDIATVDGQTGINASGNTTLQTGGALTQSSAINTDGLALLGGQLATLNNGSNQINKLAANVSSLQLTNSKTLAVDSVNGTTGISATGSVQIQTQGAASNIVLNQDILADTDANALATDNTIVLASANNFINNAGNNALQPGNGRFLVYSAHPDSDTRGGLNATPQYNHTYAGNPPATVGGGNRFVYSVAPVLDIQPADIQRFYGSANPPLALSVSGLIGGDLQADVLSGSAIMNTVANAASNANTYTINIALGTLAADFGYQMNLNTGTLTVAKAPLVVSADNLTRTYGDENPSLTFDYSGFVLGEDTSALTTAPTAYTNATSASDVGSYDILFAGGSALNYSFVFQPGALAITPAMLTITAENAQRAMFAENPAFTASVNGLRAGDTPETLDDPLTFLTSAAYGSPSGIYAIQPYASDKNYTITLNPGKLTVMLGDSVADYILVEEKENAVKLVRQSTLEDTTLTFTRTQPIALWPPKEFPVRFAERGQDTITTTTAWVNDDSKENHYHVTSQNYIHEDFRIVFRDKAGGFKTHFIDSGPKERISILTKSSYYEFLDQERDITAVTLLSETWQ